MTTQQLKSDIFVHFLYLFYIPYTSDKYIALVNLNALLCYFREAPIELFCDENAQDKVKAKNSRLNCLYCNGPTSGSEVVENESKSMAGN